MQAYACTCIGHSTSLLPDTARDTLQLGETHVIACFLSFEELPSQHFSKAAFLRILQTGPRPNSLSRFNKRKRKKKNTEIKIIQMAALAVEHHRLVDSAASSSLHLAQSSPNPSSALPPKEPLAASLDASVANGNNQLNGMSRSSGGSSGADLDPALALELSRHPHHHLGTWLYHPPPPVLPADSQMFATTSPATCFLPPLDALVNSTLQVVVPARDLTAANPAVHLAALWGTDIYTDDSDIVASASPFFPIDFIEKKKLTE
ncbi:hypothetical protein BC828DRAFT_26016 [Blastocladiella britannica]|nr:hypothetical protein BC828DRAFT_26016 [Blastocladiella britannica]